MSLEQHLQSCSEGARFRRADLHIHSFGTGGSTDVSDTGMTPERIVDAACAEGIEVIAIADHNSIGNVEQAVSYASGKPLLVVPAVELSTSQGHLLVYFETFERLRTFVGKLDISPDRKTCSQTLQQCLSLCGEGGGFGILAHIELDSGLEGAMPKFNQFKEDVICAEALLGLEIARRESANWYTAFDDSPDRKRLIAARRERIRLGEGYELARVMSSDAHSVDAFGKNAAGDKKLIRVKMESLSFEALRLALSDAGARIRLEDVIPSDIPRFVGIRCTGGFLGDQTVRFSKNLTCIIGGRGTGKSTLLESLRVTAGASVRRDNLVDSEVWPDTIELLYQDETGRTELLQRDKQRETVNRTDPQNGVTRVLIESYGQGDTAETIQHSDKDPSVLLRFLDDFIPISSLQDDDRHTRDEMLENQSGIERLLLDVRTIPDVEKAKNNADAQLKLLKEKEAGKLVELEEKLAKGRAFRLQLVDDLNHVVKHARECLAQTSTFESVLSRDATNLPVGREEFDQVRAIVENFAKRLDAHAAEIQKDCTEVVGQLKTRLVKWRDSEGKVQDEISTIRKQLEAQNIRLDLAFIRKVTTDATEYEKRLKELAKKKTALQELQKARTALVAKRQATNKQIYNERAKLALQLEANLRSTVLDYTITVKFHEAVYSPEMEEVIKKAMDYRTSRVPRAAVLSQTMSPLAMCEVVRRKRYDAFTSIISEGQQLFSVADAEQIVERLSQQDVLFQLERCAYDDRPEIKVTGIVKDTGGSTRSVTKDFAKLSLGQQQSILLSIMLFSRNACPLIIDQPEDNLDSEFIYKTFVSTLRTIKERRQVIVVTHNANIAVLGDAELIVPLKATHERSTIQSAGSIDTPHTRELSCSILEGSKEAFVKRMVVYGVK